MRKSNILNWSRKIFAVHDGQATHNADVIDDFAHANDHLRPKVWYKNDRKSEVDRLNFN